ncbi:MAG: hypothetical protein WC707_02215 [Candidatus Babeliaceae bacterium]|jgi:hypothetical protein
MHKIMCTIFLFVSHIAKPMHEPDEYLKIVGLCTGAAVTYGITACQISIRVSVEQFHDQVNKQALNPSAKNLLRSLSPTNAGILWGLDTSWWMGIVLGAPLAFTARYGSWPQIGASQLIMPLGVAVGTVATVSALSGCAAFGLKSFASAAERQPHDTQARNMNKSIAVDRAHSMAYKTAVVTGIGLCGYALYKRHAMC